MYSNPEFNWMQMEQIRMGLKDNVDPAAAFRLHLNYSYLLPYLPFILISDHNIWIYQKTPYITIISDKPQKVHRFYCRHPACPVG